MALIRIPGTARRYRDTLTGDEISRRQYQKRAGKPLPKTVAQPGKLRRYTRIRDDYIRQRKREGFTLTKGGVKTDKRLKLIARALRSGTDAEKEWADIAIGRRPGDWELYVGEMAA